MFLPDLDGGGAQRTLVNLANAIGAAGMAPQLAVGRANGPARDWLATNVPIEDLGAARLRQTPVALRRLIQQRRPDLLLSTMVDANVVATLAAKGLPPRIILRETNSHRARQDLGWMRRRLAGWAYRRADAVVALSEGVRRELVDDYHLDSACAHTIHNPVQVDAIGKAVAEAHKRPAPAAVDGPLILAAGRLVRQKGFDILLRAFANLDDKRTHLAILGEGAEREPLQTLARQLGIADRLIMPGFVADTMPWFAHAELFVLSSRWEGFGHVIVEAMAAGVPVIATRCPHGPADILMDGKTGLLVMPEDSVALCAAMNKLLTHDRQAQRLAATARPAANKFAATQIARKYVQLFNHLLRDRR